MTRIVATLAHVSAIAGGVALTVLALFMTLSITGGAIAKLGHANWLAEWFPDFATWIQNTGIRTIPGMYEIVKIGIAFVVFAFLPIVSWYRGHAVVDVFTNFLPRRINQGLLVFWEIIFFVIFAIIAWRLFYGMERMMQSNIVSADLQIPEWYGYSIAFGQMLLASFTAAYVVFAESVKLFLGEKVTL